jgi:Flp pilus assembly protein CpaB
MTMKMGKREIIYLMVGITPWILAMGLFYLWSQQLCTPPPSETVQKVAVVVSAESIEAGTTLEESHLRVKKIPEQFLPAGPLFANDIESHLGKTILIDIEEQSLILSGDLLSE